MKNIFQIPLFDLIFTKKRPIKQRPKRTIEKNPESAVELQLLWKKIRLEYFPERSDIDSYVIAWSQRSQKRTLASCNIRQRRVIVARSLNFEKYEMWLEPIVYHEMCHAIIGENVERRGRKKFWHGREFRLLESRHPDIKKLNEWISSGGWNTAVRSERAIRQHARRKL